MKFLVLPRRRLCTLFVLIAASVFAANEPAWRYKTWSSDITIPEGAYRGDAKGVAVENDRTVSIGTGAVIEGAKLRGERSPHWKIDGSLLRDVEICGDLGLQFDAKDSAFDGCALHKTGAWFVDAFSTQWRFENCVISREFIGKVFGVGDYGVRAVKCTFYNMTLPKIAYKGDPADYAQTDNLKFEHCRFVNCEVNYSFLLSTIDCVFEECRFPAKQDDISKLKKPINVTAYIASRANPPKPFEKGAVKIEFKSDPTAEGGASIPVTHTSGRLTYTTLRPGPAQNLGSLDGTTAELAKNETAKSEPNSPGKAKNTPTPLPPVGEKNLKLFDGPINNAGAANTTPPTIAPNGIVSLRSQKATLGAPLLLPQPGGGFAALNVKLTATATANPQLATSEINCLAFPGPDGVRAAGFVKQQLLKRHNGWPRGMQIDIASAERPVGADLPASLLSQALIVDSMILGYDIDPTFVALGGFDIDGDLTPPLAAGTRVLAAFRGGATRMAVPEKCIAQVADVMLAEGAAKFSTVQIFAVSEFKEIPPLAVAKLDDQVMRATATFGRAQAVLRDAADRGDAGLTDSRVKDALRQVLIEAPNHLTARLLLGHGAGQFNNFTLSGSIETVEQRAPNLARAARCSVPSAVAGIPADRPADEVAKLKDLREKLDDKAQPWLDALVRYGTAVTNWHANPVRTGIQNSQLVTELNAAGRLVQTEWSKLIALRDTSK